MNLEGVNVAWVTERLSEFLAETVGVERTTFATVLNPSLVPRCGRERAIVLSERVRPILTRLYPEWEAENTASANEEFRGIRDAAQRVLTRLESYEEVSEMLGGGDESPRISASGLHPMVWTAASPHWATGHRHEAVLAASKVANSLLQARVGRRDVSERDLVQQAFSDKDPEPGKPRLRFPHIDDEQTRASMRLGVMNFGAGCFSAIRNPVGHLPNELLELTEHTALERLCALSLFVRWIEEAELEEAAVTEDEDPGADADPTPAGS
ncbi:MULTISPECIES: TIGR02391 family protein [Nocardia]|uniref:TIGR02391 family protein n=1 Tax=Nocardia TaxID=1817 RepID=UPI0024540BE9|nr:MULTISPECIES: TIGR02391 family protein [Nocardia]